MEILEIFEYTCQPSPKLIYIDFIPRTESQINEWIKALWKANLSIINGRWHPLPVYGFTFPQQSSCQVSKWIHYKDSTNYLTVGRVRSFHFTRIQYTTFVIQSVEKRTSISLSFSEQVIGISSLFPRSESEKWHSLILLEGYCKWLLTEPMTAPNTLSKETKPLPVGNSQITQLSSNREYKQQFNTWK